MHICTGIKMKTSVLQYLLLLMYATCCSVVVGEQACQLNFPPAPVQVTAAPTADGIAVSWRWNGSTSSVLTCIRNLRIIYQPRGDMNKSFDAAKSSTRLNLTGQQCNMGCAIIIWSVDVNGSITNTACTTSAPTGVRVEIIGSTSVTVTWQWSGDQSMCWNTTFLQYQSERSAPMLMKLNNPNINSATFTNLQCGTRYNFTVVVITTTFINESNTARIHLGGCAPSATPSQPTSVVGTEAPQDKPATTPSSTPSGGEPSSASSPLVSTVSTSTDSGTLSPPFTSKSTSTGTPGREEPTSISTVGVPISDHRTHTTPDNSGSSTTDGGPTTGSEPTTDGGPTTDGEPTIDGGPTTDGNSEPSGNDELHNGTTPQSGTRGGGSVTIAAVVVVLVGLIILLPVIIVMVLMIRWCKQRKGGILSHIPVVLAEIQPDSYSDGDNSNNTYGALIVTAPVIEEYKEMIHACEGEQVTLKIKVLGFPKPTITWSNSGRVTEASYAIDIEQDGSLTFVSVELKHSGTYHFIATNEGGSVEGTTELVVHAESEREELRSDPIVESKPVVVAKFGDYVSSLHAQSNKRFTSQFWALPTGESGHTVQVARNVNNHNWNRFHKIVAYDDHRVTLSPIDGYANCDHNYINASYIDGYSKPRKFIATQGPLPTTITDFWRLAWQEKVKVIVILTNVVEGGQQKCEQYWPDQEPQEYGPFTVTLADQQVFADYIIRTLNVMHAEKRRSLRSVFQIHFRAWPDHGVPEYAGPILTFLHRVNTQLTTSKGPLLIHCSAGVGRTGTLITIDIALEKAAKEGIVDIPAVVYKIRRQRMKMVQTVDQYSFIHDVVLESLICGNTQIPASDLRKAITDMGKMGKPSRRMKFETQFCVLDQVSPKPTEVIRATALRYPQKNRSNEFLPPDQWRVILKAERLDYINASFVNGYKQYKGFIVTQAPIKNTCQDFWKMVFERGCGLIVMLSDLVENGEEICYQYWPGSSSETEKNGEFSVTMLEMVNRDGFVQRLISITDPKSGQVHKVTQLQLSNWTPDGLCTSPNTLVAATSLLFVVQRRCGNKPIVVHGRDTVSRCGIFCALVNVIERCKTEGIVDVFEAVKALRTQKPGSVSTLKQYRFIFDLMLLFLDSFSSYSNFL